MRSKYFLILIAVVGTFLAVIWQEVNLSHVKKNIPDREEYGRIVTADDGSYVQPAINFRKKGVWKDYAQGNSSYVQRPPGYGFLFYLGTYLSPSNPYFFLKIIQIIGFAFSIILMFQFLKLLDLNEKWAIGATAFYALMPMFSGFLYHVITEGLTPVLLLWSLYEWILILKEKGNKPRWIASNAFLLLVRPQLALFVLVFMCYLLIKKQFKLLAWSTLILLPFALWMGRVYSYTETVSIHPIYAENNASYYRPPHQEMGELFKIWEYKSDRFHETIAILQNSEDKESVEFAMQNVPEKYHRGMPGIFMWYQQICKLEREGIEKGDFKDVLKYERNFTRSVREHKEDLVMNNLTDAYLITPMKSSKELFVKSHLHLTIFQAKYRGTIWVEGLRWISLLVVLLGIASLFVVVIFRRKVSKELWLICLAGVVTILYLVFVQRLNEERYLTPILPMAFIASVWMCNSIVQRFQKRI